MNEPMKTPIKRLYSLLGIYRLDRDGIAYPIDRKWYRAHRGAAKFKCYGDHAPTYAALRSDLAALFAADFAADCPTRGSVHGQVFFLLGSIFGASYSFEICDDGSIGYEQDHVGHSVSSFWGGLLEALDHAHKDGLL